MEMAFPDRPEAWASLFRAATASSQAGALREVMKIWEQPAWRRLERWKRELVWRLVDRIV